MTIKCVSLIDIYQKRLERNFYLEPVNSNRIKQAYIYISYDCNNNNLNDKKLFFFLLSLVMFTFIRRSSSSAHTHARKSGISNIHTSFCRRVIMFIEDSVLLSRYLFHWPMLSDADKSATDKSAPCCRAARDEFAIAKRKNLAFGLCFLSHPVFTSTMICALTYKNRL